MTRLPTAEEVWERIATELEPLPVELAPRAEAAGRVLAEDLAAASDLPALDVSAMDGYVIAASVKTGERLEVTGTIAAGDPPGFRLKPGRAARIMTGAPVPAGGISVVPIEHTDGGEDRVTFHQDSRDNANIRRRGEVLERGDPLLLAGHVLTPGALSLLASQGHDRVPLHRRPRMAILTTGDEVVPPERDPRPGQLRDSHTDFLSAAAETLGLKVEPLGIAADDRDDLASRLERAVLSDVAIVTGGVSKGAFDFVPGVLSDLGCRILSEAVAVQPGKPLLVARHQKGWVFGLPGNPASVMVCFWLFVRPLVRRLGGLPDGYWHGAIDARLATELPASKDRDRFVPALVESRSGELWARPVAVKGSHDLLAFAHGGALIRIRAGSPPAASGSRCQLLLLDSSWIGEPAA